MKNAQAVEDRLAVDRCNCILHVTGEMIKKAFREKKPTIICANCARKLSMEEIEEIITHYGRG